ncbi:13460_t:CDS:2, partial [Gigaspora rosea]
NYTCSGKKATVLCDGRGIAQKGKQKYLQAVPCEAQPTTYEEIDDELKNIYLYDFKETYYEAIKQYLEKTRKEYDDLNLLIRLIEIEKDPTNIITEKDRIQNYKEMIWYTFETTPIDIRLEQQAYNQIRKFTNKEPEKALPRKWMTLEK